MEVKADQVIAIKVMRLSRPMLASTDFITSDPWDLPGQFDSIATDPLQDEFTKQIPLAGTSLILPQSFGTIYLGETFQSYLRVQNVGTQSVFNVTVKADLQTAAQRIQLTKKTATSSIVQVDPQQSIDEILNHEVTEIGTHILVCEVSYQLASGEPMLSASRYYKFQVLKPCEVKTKFYNAESDDVYLEAQIQNITDGPIHLEKVALEPSPLFKVISHNELSPLMEDRHLFGLVNVVQPGEVRQYLYCLKPSEEARRDFRILRGESNIGKLDLVWRTSFGDRGRLQTSQLQRMVPSYGDIRLTIEELPNPVKLHQSINLVCRITNTSERPVELSLVFETRSNKPAAVLWTGVSNRPLNKIDPGCSAEMTLTLVPILPGLQSVSGLKLVDLFLKRTYDYPDLAQVLVVP